VDKEIKIGEQKVRCTSISLIAQLATQIACSIIDGRARCQAETDIANEEQRDAIAEASVGLARRIIELSE